MAGLPPSCIRPRRRRRGQRVASVRTCHRANGAHGRVLRALYNYALDRAATLPPNPVRLRAAVAPGAGTRAPPRHRRAAGVLSSGRWRCRTRSGATICCWRCSPACDGGKRRSCAGADVDLKALRTLTIPALQTKARRTLDLPLTDFVHDLLVARRAIGKTEFVFFATSASGHIEEPKFFLEQVAAACGVRVSVHDLRRTYITVAGEAATSLPTALRALVNHSARSPT